MFPPWPRALNRKTGSVRTEKGKRSRSRALRPRLEPLEDRLLLSTFVVTNTNDSGPGSLRNAILSVNSDIFPGIDRIRFAIGSGVQTIVPLSALPTITHPVVIDGGSQPGFAGTPLIELDGASAGTAANGLTITAGSSTVKDLAINRFSLDGILLQTIANLGIELDAANSANGSLPAPVLTSVVSSGGFTVLQGTLTTGVAFTSYTIEFYVNPASAPSPVEGEKFLASFTVTTVGSGVASFTFGLARSLAPGLLITATTTFSPRFPPGCRRYLGVLQRGGGYAVSHGKGPRRTLSSRSDLYVRARSCNTNPKRERGPRLQGPRLRGPRLRFGLVCRATSV